MSSQSDCVVMNSTHVVCPEASSVSSEHVVDVEDMKHMVQLLHTALHLPDHHLLKERQLLERLDGLKQDLSPLEQVPEGCTSDSVSLLFFLFPSVCQYLLSFFISLASLVSSLSSLCDSYYLSLWSTTIKLSR